MSSDDPVGTPQRIPNAVVVEHADVVAQANTTDSAGMVGHADHVEHLEIHGEAVRSPKARLLGVVNDIARNLVVLCALFVMGVVIFTNNAESSSLRTQLQEFQNSRTASDKLIADKLTCSTRYQDKVDDYTEQQLILIGEFLVIITQNPPGEERARLTEANSFELDQVNRDARNAKIAKIEYNNEGYPLPCPLPEASIPPERPPLAPTIIPDPTDPTLSATSIP